MTNWAGFSIKENDMYVQTITMQEKESGKVIFHLEYDPSVHELSFGLVEKRAGGPESSEIEEEETSFCGNQYEVR